MSRKPPTRKYRKRKSGVDPVLPPFSAGASLRIRQVRSAIGRVPAQRKTLEALGLRHHQDEVVKQDHPALRGMLYRVRHLVVVSPAEAARKGK
jgi:large subunit ribosomal protein L30